MWDRGQSSHKKTIQKPIYDCDESNKHATHSMRKKNFISRNFWNLKDFLSLAPKSLVLFTVTLSRVQNLKE